jgi:uncharacterized protein YegJ (DUF2314 family)
MKLRSGLVTAILLWQVLISIGCSKPQPPVDQSSDQTISVSDDDAIMNAAIAKARSTLPDFWQVFEKPQKSESNFALKVKITDGQEVEHFWAIDIERKDGKILGTINNDPEMVHNVKTGQRITIGEADISDWLYMRDGKMVGNFTLRALFDKMPKNEVEKMKKILADP